MFNSHFCPLFNTRKWMVMIRLCLITLGIILHLMQYLHIFEWIQQKILTLFAALSLYTWFFIQFYFKFIKKHSLIFFPKGQIISKCLFSVFNFLQETRFHSQVEFVRSFFEETSTWKNYFDFFWPLKQFSFNLSI